MTKKDIPRRWYVGKISQTKLSRSYGMLANILQNLLNGLGKVLGVLNSIDPTVRAPIAVSFGAIAGALSRYYLTLWFAKAFGTSFPYGTFVINLSGALVMGFFTTLVLERVIVSPDLRLAIAVGFLGSYTTFSTYALDTATLLRTGQRAALFYWAGSAILGLLSLEVGSFLARRLPGVSGSN